MPCNSASVSGRRAHERGVVVIVTLLAILFMALSASALVRSIDTLTAVDGNLGFMQASLLCADEAIENAIAALFERRSISDQSLDDPSNGYYASRQAGENSRGVPLALQGGAQFGAGTATLDPGGNIVLRYVIERMCVAPGPAVPDNCSLVPVAEPPLIVPGETRVDPPVVPFFRVTIRIDGPAHATQFVQAWLADIPTQRRLAWRAVAD